MGKGSKKKGETASTDSSFEVLCCKEEQGIEVLGEGGCEIKEFLKNLFFKGGSEEEVTAYCYAVAIEPEERVENLMRQVVVVRGMCAGGFLE